MASRIHSPKMARGVHRVDYDLSFSPNGVGAPSVLTGIGYSVARTGVGVFVLTFTYPYVELLKAEASLQLAAFANSDVILGPWNSATKQLTLFVNTAGVAADIAAAANNVIHVGVTFRNSKLKT